MPSGQASFLLTACKEALKNTVVFALRRAPKGKAPAGLGAWLPSWS